MLRPTLPRAAGWTRKEVQRTELTTTQRVLGGSKDVREMAAAHPAVALAAAKGKGRASELMLAQAQRFIRWSQEQYWLRWVVRLMAALTLWNVYSTWQGASARAVLSQREAIATGYKTLALREAEACAERRAAVRRVVSDYAAAHASKPMTADSLRELKEAVARAGMIEEVDVANFWDTTLAEMKHAEIVRRVREEYAQRGAVGARKVLTGRVVVEREAPSGEAVTQAEEGVGLQKVVMPLFPERQREIEEEKRRKSSQASTIFDSIREAVVGASQTPAAPQAA